MTDILQTAFLNVLSRMKMFEFPYTSLKVFHIGLLDTKSALHILLETHYVVFPYQNGTQIWSSLGSNGLI